jgi:hypothetical protein
MNYKELRQLASAAVKAEKNAPVAYSFGEENFSTAQVNEALRSELDTLYSDPATPNRVVFALIEETINDVLPAKVEQTYMQFAETKTVPQGDRAIFKQRVTEAARRRAKTFVTRVGLAGRYETFKLDGKQLEIFPNAVGAAARIEFEEFLDGRWQFADFVDIVMEGLNEYIYKEVAKALSDLVVSLPAVNKAEVAGFDEATMDELLAIANAYGKPSIYCTYEFASKMIPASQWASSEMKTKLWEQGYLGNYKGHNVIILPQSFEDETNQVKVIDPAQAYIIPAGQDNKPVKIVFEGSLQVREVDSNDDWSRDIQYYQKVGVGIFANNWICSYRNTNLKKASRSN